MTSSTKFILRQQIKLANGDVQWQDVETIETDKDYVAQLRVLKILETAQQSGIKVKDLSLVQVVETEVKILSPSHLRKS